MPLITFICFNQDSFLYPDDLHYSPAGDSPTAIGLSGSVIQ